MKNEKGQSLTEFLVLVPVFFILICGFIAIFQSKIRLDTDEHTKFVLGNSQAFFSDEERGLAQWSSLLDSPKVVFEKDANLGLNPSEGFPGAGDKKNGVYFDKKKIGVQSGATCNAEVGAAVQLSGNGGFTLQSCSDASGYDTAQLETADDLISTIQGKLDFSGRSLFFSDFFTYSKRKEAPHLAYNNFRQKSYHSMDYFDNYAAITYTTQSNFTYDCLMNPWEDRWQPANENGIPIHKSSKKSSSSPSSSNFSGSSYASSSAKKGTGKGTFKKQVKDEIKKKIPEGKDLYDYVKKKLEGGIKPGPKDGIHFEWKDEIAAMREGIQERRASSTCQPSFPANAFSEAALSLAEKEILACKSEIAVTCAATLAGWAGCTFFRYGLMWGAIFAGQQPSECPIVNASVNTFTQATDLYLNLYLLPTDLTAEGIRRTAITPSFEDH